MTTYSSITNAEVAIGARIDTALMTALRDNALAIGENDSSVPDIARTALPLFTDRTLSGAGSSDTVTGLDLTTFTRLLVQGTDVSGTTTANLRFGGDDVIVSQTMTQQTDFWVFIELHTGTGLSQSELTPTAPAYMKTTTTNASTSIALAWTSGTFDNGTWSAWALK